MTTQAPILTFEGGCDSYGVFLERIAERDRIIAEENRRFSYHDTASFIEVAHMIHGGAYNYSEVEYVAQDKPVRITCHGHGHKKPRSFYKYPHNHLGHYDDGWPMGSIGGRGYGCRICENTPLGGYNFEDWCAFTKPVPWRRRFTYEDFKFVDMHTPGRIYCTEHEGYFQKSPAEFMERPTCPECSKGGFNNQKEALLYYLRIDAPGQSRRWKIGITTDCLLNRFGRDKYRTDIEIEIVFFWHMVGVEAERLEQQILKQFAEQRSPVPGLLDSGGGTELFDTDVLCLDGTNRMHMGAIAHPWHYSPQTGASRYSNDDAHADPFWHHRLFNTWGNQPVRSVDCARQQASEESVLINAPADDGWF